jgi:hypothetical protein
MLPIGAVPEGHGAAENPRQNLPANKKTEGEIHESGGDAAQWAQN